MLNIAVVGTGIIGRDHMKAMKNSDLCRLCAVCDLDSIKAQEYAKEYGVPYFINYKDIPTKTNLDAVILNLPHKIHCEATEFYLNSGIHVLVEKPMANTVVECDRMINAAKKSGKKLAVGHVQRFFSANIRVKETIDSSILGELCMFSEHRTIDYFAPSRPKWFFDKESAGGGIIMNYGAHALDKLFYVTDCYEAQVSASFGNIKNNFDIEGHAQILLKMANGVSASISFCGYAPSGYETFYYFTNGTLKVINGIELWINDSGEWRKDTTDDGKSMQRQLEEFCRFVHDEPSKIADGSYGRNLIAIIENIYNS